MSDTAINFMIRVILASCVTIVIVMMGFSWPNALLMSITALILSYIFDMTWNTIRRIKDGAG
jgi:hypothetical protein